MAGATAQFIKANSNLRQRAMKSRRGKPVVMAPDLKQKIDEIFSNSGNEFHDEAVNLIARLDSEISKLMREEDPSERLTIIEDTAGELRGMGAMFDFPLVTVLAKCLIDLTEGIDTLHPNLVRIMALNSAAIACVLRNKVKGNGGRVEAEVIAALGEAKVRVRDRYCIQHLRRISDATDRLSDSQHGTHASPSSEGPKWSRLKMAAMGAQQIKNALAARNVAPVRP